MMVRKIWQMVLPWGLFAVALSCGVADAQAEMERPPLRHIAAAACGECHQEIFREWQASMHAQSSALHDPLHGAMYRVMIGDPTQEGVQTPKTGGYPECLRCHAPNAAQDGKTRLDAMAAYTEGVNCVSCHTMEAFHGVKGSDGQLRLGNAAYTFSLKELQGPYGAHHGQAPAMSPGNGAGAPPTVNPFPHVQNGTLFQSSDLCLGCHEQQNNPQGVPVCATGPELAAAGQTVTCQSCHMPTVNGHASHAMAGGHDASMLKRGVTLDLVATAQGEQVLVNVTLRNNLVHNFPTGAPFRWVALQLTARDASGQTIWKNDPATLGKEDEQAMLMMKLVDAEGRPVPPAMATKLAGDSRLKPQETRTLAYHIPAKGVQSVQAELRYGLLLPPMMHKMADKVPAEAMQPVVFTKVIRTISR
ncbi:MAG: cytochrome c family protein [Magnetococcales bacterium]|nr:cytochrome c family protein [Magnetococcales bacterium]MBF0321467.1 cytochrome c family protein [Magnetococcales bacterium]